MGRSSAAAAAWSAGILAVRRVRGSSSASPSGGRTAGTPPVDSSGRLTLAGESQSTAPFLRTPQCLLLSCMTGLPHHDRSQDCTVVRLTFTPPPAPPGASLLLRRQQMYVPDGAHQYSS